MSHAAFEPLSSPDRDVLGEGPWWDAATGYLTWVDIMGHALRRARLDGSDYATVTTPSEPGFAVVATDGDTLVGLRDGLYRLDHATGETTRLTHAPYDHTVNRANDGKTDHRGRVWFGTKNDPETAATAALYRYDGGTTTEVLDGVTISNGLGWSPDQRVMYYTDTPTRQILAYDFDPDTAAMTRPRVFAEDPAGRYPDGLTVDDDGCVWGAKWDGGVVVRYAPDGREIGRVELPVARITSCAFVGDDRSTLAVTTAQTPGADEPLAGSVLLVDVGVTGPVAHRAVVPPRPS